MRDTEQLQNQIWFELDQAKCPITKEKFVKQLACSEYEFDEAKKALVRSGKLYHCQEGYVLQEYATYDQQLWHLAWSLGLLEVSAIHIEMDQELLLTAPAVIKKLLTEGRMKAGHRKHLNRLRQQVIAAMDMPKRLLQMYHQVEDVIEHEEEQTRLLTEGPKIFKDFKDLRRLRK